MEENKVCEIHVKGFTMDTVKVILMDENGTVSRQERPTTFEEDYPLINVEEILSSACICNHVPKNDDEEKRLKTSLEIAKTMHAENFRYSAKSPEMIVRNPEWWYDYCKTINPEHNSRMGLQFQYDLYLAMQIKELVDQGLDEAEAWEEVCSFNEEAQKYYLRRNDFYGFSIANGSERRYFKYRHMRPDEYEKTVGWIVMDE